MILVTGAAGFIGFHLCAKLLERGDPVVGFDNFTDYYDVQLKRDRINQIAGHKNFTFFEMDLCDREALQELFHKQPIKRICHLAAQVGVRYSLRDPYVYQKSNLEGFLNIIECAREHQVENFVYASSSSIYGNTEKIPFAETDRADTPISFYGTTKRSNELTAYTYSHLYGLPCIGLRFFTVYGPWMRPDMALLIFTQKILAGTPIDVYGQGKMKRNFTYIDDIIQGVVLSLDRPKPFAIYNIGNDRTEDLERYIDVLEQCLGKKAIRNYMPQQAGDLPETWADIQLIKKECGYQPTTQIDSGIKKFVEWYKGYYPQNGDSV